jgi:hypothetical protein
MLLPEHVVVRATNHATDEEMKEKKDEEKARWWAKERTKLD